jgi:hypothetical protein
MVKHQYTPDKIKMDRDLEIYAKCFSFAENNNQTIGKDKMYFVTIEQLELLLGNEEPTPYES